MLEDWSFWIVQIVTLVTFCLLVWHAFTRPKEKLHWVATLVSAILFGFIVEYLIVHDPTPAYCYNPKFPSIAGVPIWVGVGWGMIIYASEWTAEFLLLNPFFEGLAAGFLAVSVDLSLDPVAVVYRFWEWRPTPVSYFGVPFHNLAAWMLIVASYVWAVYIILRIIRHFSPVFDETDPPCWVQLTAPALALLASGGIFFGVVRRLARTVSFGEGGGWDAMLFGTMFVTSGLVVWLYAFHAKRCEEKASWPTLVLPLSFHIVAFCLAFSRAKEAAPLIAMIPMNTTVAFFAFSWPFLDVILAAGNNTPLRRQVSYEPPPVKGAAAPRPATST